MRKIMAIGIGLSMVLFLCKSHKKSPLLMNTLKGRVPIVIGHRGAPGYLPDHTIEGYLLAIEQGADYIEPDLVMTKDGVLICRHEPMLSGTTDVAQHDEFAPRKTIKILDGLAIEDWFACDFTLSEIKTLRAVQPLHERLQIYNGQYLIPTFQEVLDLIISGKDVKGKLTGIYPEIKHPTFHETNKLWITDKLIEMLERSGLNNKDAPVYIQSFEVASLKYIRAKSSVKLIQLYDGDAVDRDGNIIAGFQSRPYDFVVAGDKRTYNDLITDEGLDFVKTYADGIGVWKPYIIPYTYTDADNDGKADDINADRMINDADKKKLEPTGLIKKAHKKGLAVHAYTFRNESGRLLKDYENNPFAEYEDFYKLGIDGVFSDFPLTAVSARNRFFSVR